MLSCAYAKMFRYIFVFSRERIIQETSMMGCDFNVADNY